MKLLLKLLPILFFSLNTYAQLGDTKYEFGLNAGTWIYQGDLSPSRLGSFKTPRIALGIHAHRIINDAFGIRAQFWGGSLKGDEARYDDPEYRKERAFEFHSPLWELSAQLTWNFLGGNYKDRGLSTYLFAGAGIAFIDVHRDASRINPAYFDPETATVWAGLAADQAHDPPNTIPVIPLGGGAKYFFSSRLGVQLEASYRFTTTDYLDGFSEAVNPKYKDSYMNYSIGVLYRTGKKDRMGCPAVKF